MEPTSVSLSKYHCDVLVLTSEIMLEPTDINTAPLTHILYSFADVQSDGTIVLTDSYADEQVRISFLAFIAVLSLRV